MKSFLITVIALLSIAVLNREIVYAQYNDSGQKQGSLGFYTPTPTKTPTPTYTLTPSPTRTPTPTLTLTPTPTSTPVPRICGETCGISACQTGLTCITANNGSKYCAKANAATIMNCTQNPSSSTCCSLPTNTPTPTTTPLPTSTPTTPPTATPTRTPTPTPTRAINMNCDPNEAELNPLYEFQGMHIGLGMRPDLDHVAYQWYYINYTGDVNQTLQETETIIANQTKILQSGDRKMEWDRDIAKFISDYNKYSGCPIRFTGSSPTLFVYGIEGSQFTIGINKNITYADPSLLDNMWNVSIQKHNLHVNHMQRPYIYYEYEKNNFKRPEKGWNIERKELTLFADKLSRMLQLNKTETERLAFELNHAASDVSQNTLFIGILDEDEVQEAIPLTIVPKPTTVARYHFYIGASHKKVEAPTISPLRRTTAMILELGAVGYED